MDIKIEVRNDKGGLERTKRLRLVKEYPDFNLYDVLDNQGNKLYKEYYTKSEIEGRIIK